MLNGNSSKVAVVIPSWHGREQREPAAQPVVLPNHRDRMPPLETPVPGLLLANTTQVYPDYRGTNYAVREGEDAVGALLAQVPSGLGS